MPRPATQRPFRKYLAYDYNKAFRPAFRDIVGGAPNSEVCHFQPNNFRLVNPSPPPSFVPNVFDPIRVANNYSLEHASFIDPVDGKPITGPIVSDPEFETDYWNFSATARANAHTENLLAAALRAASRRARPIMPYQSIAGWANSYAGQSGYSWGRMLEGDDYVWGRWAQSRHADYHDFVAVSLYDLGAFVPGLDWIEYCVLSARELERVYPGVPRIAWMWGEVHPLGGGGDVDPFTFASRMDLVVQHFDGAVLFDGAAAYDVHNADIENVFFSY